jgi:hypothetical protein
MQRLFYVLKLLQISRLNSTNNDNNNSNNNKAIQISTKIHNIDTVNNNNTKKFQHLTPQQLQKKLEEELKLEKFIKEQNKKVLLKLWNDIEDEIILQLQIHMVDPDVEKMIDKNENFNNNNNQNNNNNNSNVLFSNKKKTPLKSIEKNKQKIVINTANNNTNKHNNNINNNINHTDDMNDDDGNDLTILIFTPSSKLAAIVYKKCVSYSQIATKMCIEHGLVENENNNNSINNNSNSMNNNKNSNTTFFSNNKNDNKKLTILESMNLTNNNNNNNSNKDKNNLGNNNNNDDDTENAITNNNKIMFFIRIFIEDELLPVIQSTVNLDLNALQLNASLFSNANTTNNKNRYNNNVNNSINNSIIQNNNNNNNTNNLESSININNSNNNNNSSDQFICPAAKLCLKTITPLFTYWIELNHHRNMVSTILDRVIRGFSSSAKEEIENLTYKLLTFDEKLKKNLFKNLKTDEFFINYRVDLYGGKFLIENIIDYSGYNNLKNSIDSSSINNKNVSNNNNNKNINKSTENLNNLNINLNNDEGSSVQNNNNENNDNDLDTLWGTFLNMSEINYAITFDKVFYSCFFNSLLLIIIIFKILLVIIFK